MNLRKRIKTFLLIALLLTGGIIYIGYKEMYKPHSSILDSVSIFEGTTADFQNQISQSPIKYQGQIITLTGSITDFSSTDFVIDETVYCQIDSSISISNLNLTDQITLKGKFIGYDDLLEEVKLNNCIIIKY